MADALPGAAAAPVSALPGRGSRAHASSGLASSGASGPPKHLDVAASPTTPHTFDALPWKATTMMHTVPEWDLECYTFARHSGASV
jgi:hypothetical protein